MSGARRTTNLMDGVWCDFREIGVHGRSSFHTPYVLKRHFSQNFSHSLTEVTLLLPDLHAYDTAASAGCASKLERAARRPRQGAGLLPSWRGGAEHGARAAGIRPHCLLPHAVGGRAWGSGGPTLTTNASPTSKGYSTARKSSTRRRWRGAAKSTRSGAGTCDVGRARVLWASAGRLVGHLSRLTSL